MSILLFFLVLFVLILVHEWGHFIVAKKTGMRVDEFGIGFPPKLFGIKKGETEYTFNALPIGGFVRIWGENYEDKVAADQGLEAAPVVDTSRAFASRPKWAQALVLVAGVTMNILFAWFLFSLTFMVGVPTAVEESAATDAAQLYVADVLPDSPAAVLPAGSIVNQMQVGDQTIVSPTPSEFTDFIAATAPAPITVSYTHSNQEYAVDITPAQNLLPNAPEQYGVGVSLTMVETLSQSFPAALGNGFTATVDGLVSIVKGLYGLLSQAFVGEADFSQVAGPVGIVGMVGDAAAFGFTALLTFTAIISLNLAVINLLPFPALDGGRLLFVAIESVTKKQIPAVWAGRLNLVGFGILMLLMIAVTYNDIIRLL
jgi:regulator of sigma E protease